VSTIDKDRRRVALTMIAPGTERPKPERPQRGPRRREAPQRQAAQAPAEATQQPAADRTPRPPRRAEKQRRDRRGRREAPRPQRTGSYEKRAAKTLVPITKEMEEGKEFLRSFGDLLQFHQKKKEQNKPAEKPAASGGNGAHETPEANVEAQATDSSSTAGS
jgi:hypothetical protein